MNLRILQQAGVSLLLGGLLLGMVKTSTSAAPVNDLDTVYVNAIALDETDLPTATSVFPKRLEHRLRQDLSRQVNLLPAQLQLVQATQQTWSDGCLGLVRPGEFCTQAVVSGWRVVFAHQSQQWAYRTDAEGGRVRLEPAANQALRPARIPQSELPTALAKNVVLRAISTGGFAGRTYQTTLTKDGRLTQVQIYPNGNAAAPQVRRLSRQQVRQFQQVLSRLRLERFDRDDYLPPTGAADFITTTVSTQTSTFRYADLNVVQLPKPLQTTLQAWEEIRLQAEVKARKD